MENTAQGVLVLVECGQCGAKDKKAISKECGVTTNEQRKETILDWV